MASFPGQVQRRQGLLPSNALVQGQQTFTNNSAFEANVPPLLPNMRGYLHAPGHFYSYTPVQVPMPQQTPISDPQIAANPNMNFLPSTNPHFQYNSADSTRDIGGCNPDSQDIDRLSGFDRDAMPPFTDPTLKFGPTTYGVVLIRNIPYSVTKEEIKHFIARHSLMIKPHEQGNPIHIVMEHSTAKTMDCYVEVQNHEDAVSIVKYHQNLAQSGKHPRIGTRQVSVEESSQDQLLAKVFPRTKSLTWRGGIPVVLKNDDPYSSGFSGFFTGEEMVGLKRHAETPQRSPFSSKCMQRTFECMISTLYKMPWFATQYITIGDRDLLFGTYVAQLNVLIDHVSRKKVVGLNYTLLLDFIFAGANCPGFGERQKFHIVTTAGAVGAGVNLGIVGCFWPFDLVGKRDGVPDHVVRFYLHLVETGVQYHLSQRSEDRSWLHHPEYISFHPPHPYPNVDPSIVNNTQFFFTDAAKELSMESAIRMEISLMEELLWFGWERYSLAHGLEGIYIRTATESPRRSSDSGLEMNMQLVEREADENAQGKVGPTHPDFADGCNQISHTSQQTGRASLYSPPESPKGTIDPASDMLHQTPSRPITNPYMSLSARQPCTTKIDPTSASFEPRRRMSFDAPVFGNAEETEDNLGFDIDGLGNRGVADIVANSQHDRSERNSFGSTASSRGSSPKKHGVSTILPAAIRCSAAVDIRHPDGTPAVFDYAALSSRDETEQASARSEDTMAKETTYNHLFPLPLHAHTRARSGSRSGLGSLATSAGINTAVCTSPTKAAGRRKISIESTIHEETEGEDEVLVGGEKGRTGPAYRSCGISE